MAETLNSLGIVLPHDLLPDDRTLIYENGVPIGVNNLHELDFDEELVQDSKDFDRYVNLALAYFNRIHHTDYKAPEPEESETKLHRSFGRTVSIHCGFTVDSDSAPKYFFAKLFQANRGSEEVVTSCVIVDGIEPLGCRTCEGSIPYWLYGGGSDMEIDTEVDATPPRIEVAPPPPRKDDVPPPSQYSHVLADGVTLSDKAKFGLCYALPALAHYNKKRHTDYKLVDVLPYSRLKITSSLVVHCNFVAKQEAAGVDASHKLFFAELENDWACENDWVVIACRVVRGKPRAGCYLCPPHGGKRVIHPTRGYRFGLYPTIGTNVPELRSVRKSCVCQFDLLGSCSIQRSSTL